MRPSRARAPVAYRCAPVNTRRMRFVPLSDHPGDMLVEARRAREAAGGIAGERYRRELAAHEARIAEASRAPRQGQGRARSPVQAALGPDRVVAAAARPPRRPAALAPSQGEEAIKGGIKGEQEVADVLRGRARRRVGPHQGVPQQAGRDRLPAARPGGMFAIEVKYVNGTFAVTRSAGGTSGTTTTVTRSVRACCRTRAAGRRTCSSRSRSRRLSPSSPAAVSRCGCAGGAAQPPEGQGYPMRARRRSRGAHLDRAAARSRPRGAGAARRPEAGRG